MVSILDVEAVGASVAKRSITDQYELCHARLTPLSHNEASSIGPYEPASGPLEIGIKWGIRFDALGLPGCLKERVLEFFGCTFTWAAESKRQVRILSPIRTIRQCSYVRLKLKQRGV